MNKIVKILTVLSLICAIAQKTESFYVGVGTGYPGYYGGYGYPYYGYPYYGGYGYPYGYGYAPYYSAGFSYSRPTSHDRSGHRHWTVENQTNSILQINTVHDSYSLAPGQKARISHKHSFKITASTRGQTIKLQTTYHNLSFYIDNNGRFKVDKW